MDYDQVRKYIRDAFFDWNGTFGVKKTKFVWGELFQKRQNEDPDDENNELAAAEHSASMRWRVGDGDSAILSSARTLGYDELKFALGTSWLQFILPYSPPSIGSQYWGQKGVVDGARDAEAFEVDSEAAVTFGG